MSLNNAFNIILDLQSRSVTYYQVSSDTEYALKGTFSNYFRNAETSGMTVDEGREFVISVKALEPHGITVPVRGDRVIDAVTGNFTVKEVREMVILGKIEGYRLRMD